MYRITMDNEYASVYFICKLDESYGPGGGGKNRFTYPACIDVDEDRYCFTYLSS